ncbi:DUF4439 domain-containing protein, partial [Streptomyces sp. NPDC004788]
STISSSSAACTTRPVAAALREAAVRAVRWRGSDVTFPGLAERATGRA